MFASDQRKQTSRFKIKTIFKHEKHLYDLMIMAARLKIMIADLSRHNTTCCWLRQLEGSLPSPADCARAAQSSPAPQSSLHLNTKYDCVYRGLTSEVWSSTISVKTSLQVNWPLGTTMSADCTVGSMYCSNAGLTNLLYCLMMPLMSRPRWEMSLFSLRTRRMSESVSTNTFMSSSWRESGRRGGGHINQVTEGLPVSQNAIRYIRLPY